MSTKEVKLQTPFNFSGEGEDLKRSRLFLRLCENYLKANAHTFNTDEKKIYYIISFLQSGAAGHWAEAKCAAAEAAATPTRSGWGTYENFVNEFQTAFVSNNQQTEATNELISYTQEGTVTSFNAKFRSLAQEAGAREFSILSILYLKGLKKQIAQEVLRRKPRATTMETLYERALEAESDSSIQTAIHIRAIGQAPMRNFGRTMQNYQQNWRNPQPWRNQNQGRFQSNPRPFRRMTDEERMTLAKEGKCFYCKQVGHMARTCPNKNRMNIRSLTEDNTPVTGEGKNKPTPAKEPEAPITQVRQMIQGLSVQDFGNLMNSLAEEHQEPNQGQDFQ